MNWQRFSNPCSEPQDAERLQAAQDERADAWQDQAIDREEERARTEIFLERLVQVAERIQ